MSYYPSGELLLNVSRGIVRDTSAVNIFGYNASVGSSFIPMWENNTSYTYPTSNLTMSAVSSNASDTAVTLTIQGLDSDYNFANTTVTINGTTPVTINIPLFRINAVITANGNASGDITISNNGVTYAVVRAGEGRNQASIYTVPLNHEFFLYRIDAYSATALSNKYVYFRNYTQTRSGTVLRVAQSTFLNNLSIQRRTPFKYASGTDIQLQAKSSSQENEVGIFAEGILIKKPLSG